MKNETHTSSHIQIALGDVAYIELPGFNEAEKVSKTISLGDILQDLKSQADIELDFSADGVLIGIEILSI
jgi:uncharacterized protein YuzE